MKKEKEIAFFYCSHQGERVGRIVEGLNGGIKIRQAALPCSGKLEVYQLTRALENGAQGVALFGCAEEKCRYAVGSTRAKGRFSYAEKILQAIGLETDRIRRFVLEDGTDGKPLSQVKEWVEKVRAMESLKIQDAD